MMKWLHITLPGVLLGSLAMGADLNAGRDVAERLLAESRAAREQAAAAGRLLRNASDLSALEQQTAALENHAQSIRSLLSELEASSTLNARQQESLATAKTTAEVLAIMLSNKKIVLEAGSSKSAREAARQYARAVELRAQMLERLVRELGF